jgi:hypothetical protein
MEGGARRTSGPTSPDTSAAGRMAITLDVITAGAQGAMVLHPAGAQGRWQGVWSCAGARGVAGVGAGARSISMCGISEAPRSLIPLMVGMAHNTPLPSSMDWSITRTVVIANQRCGRLIGRKLVAWPRGRKEL